MSKNGKLIKISEQNYERLSKVGKFHDTFDSILDNLFNQIENKGADK